MAITASGIGSGLDVKSLVDQLVAAERQPVATRLAAQEARATAQLTGKAAGDNLRLEFAPPAEDIELSADAAQIEDAVLNLIINAIEAVGNDGQVTVTIRRAENTADEESGAEAIVEVADDGCGINEADMTRIFTPFFTKTPGGTGLGLPAVRRIARLHCGRIEVKSVPGEGSTFTLHLPLTRQ